MKLLENQEINNLTLEIDGLTSEQQEASIEDEILYLNQQLALLQSIIDIKDAQINKIKQLAYLWDTKYYDSVLLTLSSKTQNKAKKTKIKEEIK